MGTRLCREPCKGESVSDQKEPSRGRQVFLKVVCLLEPAGVWDAQAELIEPLKENHHVVSAFGFILHLRRVKPAVTITSPRMLPTYVSKNTSPVKDSDTAISSGDISIATQNSDSMTSKTPPPMKTSPTNTHWR